MTLPLEVVVLRTTEGEVPVLKNPVLSDPCLITPVLKTPVLNAPLPVPPVRNTPVLKAEPEPKTDGASKLFAVEFVYTG